MIAYRREPLVERIAERRPPCALQHGSLPCGLRAEVLDVACQTSYRAIQIRIMHRLQPMHRSLLARAHAAAFTMVTGMRASLTTRLETERLMMCPIVPVLREPMTILVLPRSAALRTIASAVAPKTTSDVCSIPLAWSRAFAARSACSPTERRRSAAI